MCSDMHLLSMTVVDFIFAKKWRFLPAVWSVGVMLYAMLFDVSPFKRVDDANEDIILQRILQVQPILAVTYA